MLSDIRKAAGGDNAAFARLVERHQGQVFGYLGRMGLDPATAEDIAQETFLRLWRYAGRFNPDLSTTTTWIITIARNLALSHLSRPSRRREVSSGDDPPERVSEWPEPDESLMVKQRDASLRAAIVSLSVADRALLAAVYVEDLDLAQVARIEGCTTGAVKTRLHRARERLRSQLEGDDDR